MKKTRFTTLFLLLAMLATVGFSASSASAASDAETAAKYLAELGIYSGNENGDLMLDKSLTRAELAAILTYLEFVDSPNGLTDWTDWGFEHFSDPENRYNKFTDVPEWATPFVEYCYERSLMSGVSTTEFNSRGAVSPVMACTVILRYCAVAETDWDYTTSVAKARALGLLSGVSADGEIITRGDMAKLLSCRLRAA
jgi:hypothetical protein